MLGGSAAMVEIDFEPAEYAGTLPIGDGEDRKSTRLNSSHWE